MSRNRMGWLVGGMAVCLAMSSCRTVQDAQPDTGESVAGVKRAAELKKEVTKEVTRKLKNIILPEVSFRPPATMIDAVDFFKQASVDYDVNVPVDQRGGISFILKLPQTMPGDGEDADDPFLSAPTPMPLPVIPAISARNISLYDALRLVCEPTGMRFWICGGFVLIVPLSEEGSDLETRSYHTGDSFWIPLYSDEELKSFFARMGVRWPIGSSISYLFGRLRVTNNQENFEAFEEALAELIAPPPLVHVDVEVVAFRAKDIERLLMNGGMTKEALLGLRKAGKSKRGVTASAVMELDQETVVKAVQEIIYPSALVMETGAGDSNQVARVSGAGALVPSHFTMRETGMILQVIPKRSDNRSLITLAMRPHWITLERWESYPARLVMGGRYRTIPFRQPVFSVTSCETHVTVEDGDTILIGNSTATDGEWVNVGFLTAKLAHVRTDKE